MSAEIVVEDEQEVLMLMCLHRCNSAVRSPVLSVVCYIRIFWYLTIHPSQHSFHLLCSHPSVFLSYSPLAGPQYWHHPKLEVVEPEPRLTQSRIVFRYARTHVYFRQLSYDSKTLKRSTIVKTYAGLRVAPSSFIKTMEAGTKQTQGDCRTLRNSGSLSVGLSKKVENQSTRRSNDAGGGDDGHKINIGGYAILQIHQDATETRTREFVIIATTNFPV
jgi:hypothetical protein